MNGLAENVNVQIIKFETCLYISTAQCLYTMFLNERFVVCLFYDRISNDDDAP